MDSVSSSGSSVPPDTARPLGDNARGLVFSSTLLDQSLASSSASSGSEPSPDPRGALGKMLAGRGGATGEGA